MDTTFMVSDLSLHLNVAEDGDDDDDGDDDSEVSTMMPPSPTPTSMLVRGKLSLILEEAESCSTREQRSPQPESRQDDGAANNVKVTVSDVSSTSDDESSNEREGLDEQPKINDKPSNEEEEEGNVVILGSRTPDEKDVERLEEKKGDAMEAANAQTKVTSESNANDRGKEVQQMENSREKSDQCLQEQQQRQQQQQNPKQENDANEKCSFDDIQANNTPQEEDDMSNSVAPSLAVPSQSLSNLGRAEVLLDYVRTEELLLWLIPPKPSPRSCRLRLPSKPNTNVSKLPHRNPSTKEIPTTNHNSEKESGTTTAAATVFDDSAKEEKAMVVSSSSATHFATVSHAQHEIVELSNATVHAMEDCSFSLLEAMSDCKENLEQVVVAKKRDENPTAAASVASCDYKAQMQNVLPTVQHLVAITTATLDAMGNPPCSSRFGPMPDYCSSDFVSNNGIETSLTYEGNNNNSDAIAVVATTFEEEK